MIIQPLPIHASDFQNACGTTSTDLFNEALYLPSLNLVLFSPFQKISFGLIYLSLFSGVPPNFAEFLPADLLSRALRPGSPNILVLSNPSFILAYIKAHLPR